MGKPVVDAKDFNVGALLAMAHSPIRNYIIPGLTSSLIGSPSPHGTVRLFQSERDHQESVVPHSHRFDFQCWVLAGEVTNRIWERVLSAYEHADTYRESELIYNGAVGEYTTASGENARWRYRDLHCDAGQCYAMTARQVHSIHFSRGATVLFLEGPTKTDRSIFLEPFANGEVVPTFRIEPWMFKR